jgi:hypothetical protein
MRTRQKAEPVTLWSFVDEFDVVCPHCAGRAKVVRAEPPRPTRMTCLHCGKSRVQPTLQAGVLTSGNAANWPRQQYAVGDAADPYFHLPLWLQTRCAGAVLWAYNPRHLDFLSHYIGATDRPRPANGNGPRNGLLSSRLPRWLKLAKHRDEVLAAIGKMQRDEHR